MFGKKEKNKFPHLSTKTFASQRNALRRCEDEGFTLVELLVGVAVFLLIVVAVYDSYTTVFRVVYASRAKIEAISLINEQLEIVRNLPYASVGIVGGVPNGVLNHVQLINRNAYRYYATTTVRNIDDPFDGTLGGTPNDLSPADFKVVEIEVSCVDCKNFTPMVVTTRVAPKNLETATTNGALFIKVFDASGNPVQDASVHIENNQSNPPIKIDDVTNNNGMLQIVDTPPGVNAYEITVTKSGYSTDKTYSISTSNPNPTKPHATIVLQQVTQVSFVIDKLSSLVISSVTNICSPVGGMNFSLKGGRLVGINPDVLKYSQNQITDGGGLLTINNAEWDTYSLTGIDSVYDIIGTNPISPINISPNNTQNIQLIVAPKNPNTLLVTVKDSATNLPLSGVSAELTKTGYDVTNITGQGFLRQTDWSGGEGQATSTNPIKYFSSDGNIETNNPIGDILLKKIFSSYVSSGILTSSSFDIGSVSNFQQVNWSPYDQPPATGNPNIRMQIATNNDGGVWNFTGPDGTINTYYTNANKNISPTNYGNRYVRYKLFFNTASPSSSPNISDVSLTFTSQCSPPGQVYFGGLANGSYTLHLTRDGYVNQDISINISSSWQSQNVSMSSN